MNLFIFNSKKTPKAFLAAVAVVVLVFAVELFVLPINAFTVRVWEAITVKHFSYLLPGPFYPNMEIVMIEEGDLGHHTNHAVGKKVEWITDRYGYRKRNENVNKYEVVVIGDSAGAGSGLTQKDMYSEQLEKKLGLKVYPLAPANINVFLNSSRFNKNPPELVILEGIERLVPGLPKIQIKKNESKESGIKSVAKAFFKKNQWSAVLRDRIAKRIMYNYVTREMFRTGKGLRVKITSLFVRSPEKVEAQEQPQILFLDNRHNKWTSNISQESIDVIAKRIKTYKNVLNARGVRFVFFPLPDKRTIYWEDVPLKEKPVFLERLVLKLRDEGVEVLDVEGDFRKVSEEDNILLYHTDDTHWNAEGVKRAVNLTVELLEKQ